ncbi:MAG: hypothetical protein AAF962_11015 [Actinomycetota bacterium]
MRVINLVLALTIAILVVTIFSLSSPDAATGSQSMAGSGPAGPSTGQVGGEALGTARTAQADAATGVDDGASSILGHYAQPDGSEVARRGAEALARISYPWQQMLPGWTIEFHEATAGAYGYTLTRERHIDIYVRPDQSDHLLAHVVAHEIGHAVDVSLNDGDDRRRWQEQRHIEADQWWPDNRAADFATGAGDFAESFAAWQVGTYSFRSEIAAPPTDADLTLVAELARG